MTTYTYDQLGRMISKTIEGSSDGSYESATWTYSYNEKDALTWEMNPLLGSTSYSYNMFDKVSNIMYPDGTQVIYTYDRTGINIIKEEYKEAIPDSYERELVAATVYEYDGLDRVTSVQALQYPGAILRGHTVYEYYSNGPKKTQIEYISDQEVRETNYYYDDYNNLTQTKIMDVSVDDGTGNVTNALQDITFTMTYDLMGNKTSKTDARNNMTTYVYTKRNQLERVLFPDSGYVRYVYTGNGYTAKEYVYHGTEGVADPEYCTEYFHDGFGNIQEIRSPDGGNIKRTYYLNGLLKDVITLKEVADLGEKLYEIISYKYNAHGLISEVIMSPDFATGSADIVLPSDASMYVTRYEYDANGNITSQIDARDNEVFQEFDRSNRLTLLKDQLGCSIKFNDYDYLGNYRTMHDRNGVITKYVYDVIGQLMRVQDVNGTDLKAFEYDLVGNLTSVTGDEFGAYKYYVPGWLKEVSYPSLGKTIKYTYNAAGNRVGEKIFVTSDETGASEIVLKEYDCMNRLIRVTSPSGDVTEYTYDLMGRRKTLRYPNGVTVVYGYDSRHRLTSLINYAVYAGEGSPLNQEISSFVYEYDKAGNIIKRIQAIDGLEEVTYYTYDALNRLTSENYPDITIEYYYDEVGNRIFEIKEDAEGEVIEIVRYSYNEANQLVSEEVIQ